MEGPVTSTAQGATAVVPAKSKEIFDIGINERVPIAQGVALGLQNVFGMTGMFVFPGIMGRAFHLPLEQIAYLYGMTFIVCGFISVFQSVWLLRLPIIQGPYAGSFAALMVVGLLPGSSPGAAYGSFCVASIIWCLLSVSIRDFSFIGLFARYIRSPLISGMTVLFVIIQIANVSLPNWIGRPGMPGFPALTFTSGLVALLVLAGLTLWAGTNIQRLAILIALAAGTIFFACFQHIGMEAIMRAPLFVRPRWFPWGFAVRADFVVIFLLTLAPASMGSMSLYQMVADWGHEKLSPPRMSQGIFSVAVGSVLAGVVGGFSTIAYPDNIGMLRSTRVGSRYATFSAGILLILLGSCTKFDFLLVLVPMPVLSAAATLLFGIVFMHGVAMLAKVEWDDRKVMVSGLSVMVALSGLFVAPDALSAMPLTLQLIIRQPVISGGVILIVLHSLLCSEPKAGRAEGRS